jgi:hypothetical protein
MAGRSLQLPSGNMSGENPHSYSLNIEKLNTYNENDD